MKQQPALSAQLHQGTDWSTTFINAAARESARSLGRAVSSPELQADAARYPDGTAAAPHVFKKVTVAGISLLSTCSSGRSPA
jgi:hypothetical protein